MQRRLDPRSQEHLDRAERDRALARTLITPAQQALSQPPPLDWAVVVAFYAALHFVQAYLWEAQRYVPRRHDNMREAVRDTYQLRSARQEYARLLDRSWQARYVSRFRITEQDTTALVQRDLEHVRRVALTALHLPI